MTLECAMLYVRDLTQMREFYARLLQSRPVNTEWTDTWALFDVGGTRFALHQIPAEHAGTREQSPVKLIFAVDDLPAERARLTAMGVTMVQRPWQEPTESCDGVDPEGNIFQLAARTRLPHLLGQSVNA